MPLSDEFALSAENRYLREIDRYSKLASLVESICREEVRDHRIPATVQARAKTPASFREKLRIYVSQGRTEKVDSVACEDDAIAIVGDLAGVRVATYVEGDRRRVVDLIMKRFRIATREDGEPDIEEHDKDTGYRATHLQVFLKDADGSSPINRNIRDTSCEVQVCSMLAHVWNEIEHDMRYKENLQDDVLDSDLEELLDACTTSDKVVERILERHSELIARGMLSDIAGRFPSATVFAADEDAAVRVIKEAVRLGFSTLERLEVSLLAGDFVSGSMTALGRINQALLNENSELKQLDPNSAEIFLARILENHATELRTLYFQELADGSALRPARLASFIVENGVFD
jgi:ppGpp synthetase/RelA/SpoT-type nucleotidyltranferase